MAKLFARQDMIIDKYSSLPAVSGMSKDETLDYLVSHDTEFQKYDQLINKIEADLAPLNKKLDVTRERMKEIQSETARINGQAQKTPASIKNINDKVKQTTKSTEELSKKTQKLQNHASGTLKMIKGMLVSMLLFSVVSGVMNAITQGMQNIAQGSENANDVLSRLSTSFLYLKNSIASAFMPVLEALEPLITRIADSIAGFFNMIAMFTNALFNNATTVTVAKKAQVDYAASLNKTTNAAKGQLAAFDELNNIQDNTGTLSAGISDPSQMFEQVQIPEWILNITDKLKEFGKLFDFSQYLDNPNVQKLLDTFERIKSIIGTITSLLSEAQTAFIGFLSAIGLFDFLSAQFEDTFAFFKSVIDRFVTWFDERTKSTQKIFEGLSEFFTGIANGDWEMAWDGMQKVVGGFTDGFSADVDLIGGLFGDIEKFADETWKNIGNFFKTALDQIWKWINELPAKIGEALGFAFGKFNEWRDKLEVWIRTEIPKLVNNIVSWFQSLPEKFGEVWNSLVDWFNKLPQNMENVGHNLIAGLWNGILSAKNWLEEKINDFFGGFLSGFRLGTGQKEPVKPVSRFASGGIITAPTLGLMGEYPGASSNPEIVAPQSLMQSTFVASLVPLINVLEEGFDRIISTIDNKDLNTYFEGKPLARVLTPYLNEEAARIGSPLFAK